MLKISVIIPTLNEEKYLPLLLEDISKQTYKNFEVIVVDGNSNDETLKLAENYKETIRNLTAYCVDKRNVGFQRNFGVNMAKGEWIFIMDADNRIENNYFELLIEKISALDSGVIITTGVYIDKSKCVNFLLSLYINTGLFVFPKIGFPWLIGAFVGILKKDFLRLSGFHEKSILGEDYDFAKRAVGSGMKYICYFKPRYYFSFRRIEKYGFFNSLWDYLWGGAKNYIAWLNKRNWD